MDASQTKTSADDQDVARRMLAVQTPYMAMSIQANQMPALYDICAGVFAWITLAGYVVLPNTFTSLQTAHSLDGTVGGKAIQDTVRNVQILPLAGVLCGVGLVGSCSLWWVWRRNYVWLMSRIFMPGLSHSLIGLLTTVVNVLAAQGGNMSLTARVTVAVTTACGGIMLVLIVVYNQLLNRLITAQDREVARSGRPWMTGK
ncbi:hypothetical protein E8E12_000490 [Didymella heteroderae]|uniref:Uncharacterized protein n=1 Tax=Didymella heteroderae TaxID=1769908 RepID=A0A9P4WGG7_9PLEO|nr:hypothetical protein E8E12_000490 [Didymella heteroderae]